MRVVDQHPAAMNHRVSIALALVAGCVDQSPDESSTTQASSTSGQEAATDWAYTHTCAWQQLAPVSGLGSQTVAERFGLDPDCGTTLSSRTIQLPSGRTRSLGDCLGSWPPDPTWHAPLNSINSAIAMCFNWDHFSTNNFGLENNADMIGALGQAGASAAAGGDTQGALRDAFDACHYAVDRNQCGHAFGNMVCDPNAQVITPECDAFVKNFAWVGTQYGGIDTNLLASGCAYFGLANVYATAERYIRHHNPGLLLDNPAWVNNCPAACPGGDSDGATTDACQIGGTGSDPIACQNVVQNTCNSLCTPKTCAELGNPQSLVIQCGVDMCCSDAACPSGWTCNSEHRCEQTCSAILTECGPYTD